MSMPRHERNERLNRIRRVYYGWWIVIGSGLAYALMGGLNASGLPLYFLPLLREFDTSHTSLSLAFSLRSIIDVVGAPIGGVMVDRIGPRPLITGGMLIGGVGFLLLALTQSYIQFLLVLLFLVTPGFSVPDHGLAVGINWWFRQRLGLAMSLASIGFAVGGFTLTPMVGWLVLGYGWRWAAGVSGALMLLMSVPIALLFRQPKPGDTISEDKALLARLDGGPAADGHTGSQNTELVVKDFTVKEALQTKAYWLLGLSLGLRLMGQTILMVHIVPILVSKGIGEGTAAALVALVALVRLPSSIAAGVLADQWHRQRTAAITMAMGAMACAVLLWGPSGVSIGVAFAILFGMAHASNAVTWALLGQFFGRRRFGTLRGGISLAPSLTMALGPVAAGWSYDLTGSYFSTLVAVSFLYVVAGMIFWALKTPQPES